MVRGYGGPWELVGGYVGHWELVGVKGALGAGEGLRAGLLTVHYMEHLYQDTSEMRTPLTHTHTIIVQASQAVCVLQCQVSAVEPHKLNVLYGGQRSTREQYS